MSIETENWVACLEAQVGHAREVERALLAAGIEARLQKPPPKACCGGSCGCGSKVQVAVREVDVGRAQDHFRDEWLQAVKAEGTLEGLVKLKTPDLEAAAASEEGEPPCPACGTVAPLVEGACSDCGLQLD